MGTDRKRRFSGLAFNIHKLSPDVIQGSLQLLLESVVQPKLDIPSTSSLRMCCTDRTAGDFMSIWRGNLGSLAVPTVWIPAPGISSPNRMPGCNLLSRLGFGVCDCSGRGSRQFDGQGGIGVRLLGLPNDSSKHNLLPTGR